MRKPYPSDLSDDQWVIIEPLIPVNSTGRPRQVEMREVLNAIFYLNRLACPPKAGPVLMGVVQLAESQGATHAKTTRTRPDRQDPP